MYRFKAPQLLPLVARQPLKIKSRVLVRSNFQEHVGLRQSRWIRPRRATQTTNWFQEVCQAINGIKRCNYNHIIDPIRRLCDAKGIFGGLTVDGAVIAIRDKWNHIYYGKEVRLVNILVKRNIRNRKAAGLVATVAYAARTDE